MFFGGGKKKFLEGSRLRYYAYRELIAVKMVVVIFFLGGGHKFEGTAALYAPMWLRACFADTVEDAE